MLKRCILLLTLLLPQWAGAVEETIVYIQCTDAESNIHKGSGVLISDQGHVLTAAHAVPDNARCVGSIGYAEVNPSLGLIPQPIPFNVDAKVLRFRQPGTYPFVSFCDLNASSGPRDIIAAGFPANTTNGQVSYRRGLFSTATADGQGLLETDGMTTIGMSGGPVFSADLNGIIGIISGARLNTMGVVDDYAVLSNEFFKDGAKMAEADCYADERDMVSQVVENLEQTAALSARVRQLELAMALNLDWSLELQSRSRDRYPETLELSYRRVFREPHVKSIISRIYIEVAPFLSELGEHGRFREYRRENRRWAVPISSDGTAETSKFAIEVGKYFRVIDRSAKFRLTVRLRLTELADGTDVEDLAQIETVTYEFTPPDPSPN